MVRLRRSRTDRGPISTVGLLVRFTAAGLIVLLSLAALIAVVARQAGVEQARESARQVAFVTARGVVEPRLDAGVIAGQPVALQSFDTAMRKYVLQGSLVRVKVWNADGRIVYSDEPRLIGQQFPLGAEEEAALRQQGSSDVGSERPDRPENRLRASRTKKLLEVYVGVRGPRGEAHAVRGVLPVPGGDRPPARLPGSGSHRRAGCAARAESWSRFRSPGRWPGGCSGNSGSGNGCCSTLSTPRTPSVGGSRGSCTMASYRS